MTLTTTEVTVLPFGRRQRYTSWKPLVVERVFPAERRSHDVSGRRRRRFPHGSRGLNSTPAESGLLAGWASSQPVIPTCCFSRFNMYIQGDASVLPCNCIRFSGSSLHGVRIDLATSS